LPAATVRTHARSTDPALILLAEVHPDRDSHFDDNLHAASLCPAQHLRATAGRAKPQDSSRYLSGNFFIIPAFIVYPVSGNSVRRNTRSAALTPDCPRSLSITTIRSSDQPSARARSRSAYWR